MGKQSTDNKTKKMSRASQTTTNPWRVWDAQLRDTPVLFINMDKSVKRRRAIESALTYFNTVRRVPGVDASQEVPDIAHDKRVDLLTRARLMRGEGRWNSWELDNARSVGATLGHMAAWQYMVDHDIPLAMIVEDNVALKPQQLAAAVHEAFVESQGKQLFTEKTVWLLGASRWTHHRDWHKEKNDAFGKAAAAQKWKSLRGWMDMGVIMPLPAAKALLAQALPIQAHIEFFMGSASAVGDINVVTHPWCTDLMWRRSNLASTIGHDTPLWVVMCFVLAAVVVLGLIATSRALHWRRRTTQCRAAKPLVCPPQ